MGAHRCSLYRRYCIAAACIGEIDKGNCDGKYVPNRALHVHPEWVPNAGRIIDLGLVHLASPQTTLTLPNWQRPQRRLSC